ncbi:MAG: L,D-transpeptidase family protein [Sphingomonas bacterium]|nr:L,D-transpeptidase family protein [Sphingomonas bacterium]
MLRRFVLAALLLAPLPAVAQVTALEAPVLSPTLSADAALSRFYGTPRSPLWLQGSSISPAGRLLLERLRTAQHEGFAEAPALVARIDAALAAPTGKPGDTDRLLSKGLLGLVGALNGPTPGAQYFHSETRPTGELPDRTLFLASRAPDLALHLTTALRKSRFYEDLRLAMLADAAANNGQVDPRLAANLQRARLLPTTGRYLFVNPASAQLMLVDNGEVLDRMRVVVGTPQTPTPPMASKIYFVTLNPYWNVAEDLVKKIVAPRVVSQGLGYLKKSNYEAVDKYGEGATVIPATSIDWKAVLAGTEQVKMRQKPGKLNSMGMMKVPFANSYGIFLHDTANKPQFAGAARANSNGCIRLEDAPRLARWLFGDNPPVASGATPDESARLPTPMPVYVAYLTAEPTGRGVQYAKDVYSMDPAEAVSAAGSL